MKVQDFLSNREVEFEVIDHSATFDAQHMAEAVHVSGYHVAKTVLLKADEQFVVAVLPATHNVDMSDARKSLNANQVELSTEDELARHCADCQRGALPPFGSHYGMQTLVDKTLVGDEHLLFEGNTHNEAIRIKYEDFVRLEEPLIGSFAHLSTARVPVPEERNP